MKYTNVSPAKLEELRQKLTSTHQASITGTNSGQIMGHGVVANYAYRADTQTLDVDVQHHPFFIPEAVIYNQIGEALDQNPAQTAAA